MAAALRGRAFPWFVVAGAPDAADRGPSLQGTCPGRPHAVAQALSGPERALAPQSQRRGLAGNYNSQEPSRGAPRLPTLAHFRPLGR